MSIEEIADTMYLSEKPNVASPIEPVVSAAGQDFEACRQMGCKLEVWNIGGMMCIAAEDDPIYITKEQAMAFFDLQEKSTLTFNLRSKNHDKGS